MSISDGLDTDVFRRKMEKTRSMGEEKHRKIFISRQSWHFSFVNIIIEVLSPICTVTWHVNVYVSRQGKGINGETKVYFFIIVFICCSE